MATTPTVAEAFSSTGSSITLQSLRAAVEARIPTMLVGAPGVGKTATIRALAKSMGYRLVTLLGSQMDPTDVTGLPKGEVITQDEEGKDVWGTVYLAPWWQVEIQRTKKVILFLDEFSNTSSAVRAAMLTLLQNREFPNGTTMPEETIVIGAMNPTEQAADGWELDKPTTNRIMFLVWKSPRDEWFRGMLDAWGETVSKEEMFWRRRVVNFLQDNPRYLHRENDEAGGTPEAHGVNINDPSEAEVLRYAWASRRSWDNLVRIFGHLDRKDTAVQDEVASGTVGRAAAIAFREWILENDVISPEAVLNNPKSVDWATLDVSEANIIFRGVVEIIDEKNWRKAFKLLDHVAAADQQALAAAFVAEIIKKSVTATNKLPKEEIEEAKKYMRLTVANYRPKREE